MNIRNVYVIRNIKTKKYISSDNEGSFEKALIFPTKELAQLYLKTNNKKDLLQISDCTLLENRRDSTIPLK